jgi:AAA domain
MTTERLRMPLPPNPFLHRLTVYLDPQVLRERLARGAPAIGGLHLNPTHTAKRQLEEHLDTVYAPTQPGIQLALRILSSGLAHGLRAYPDVPTYITTATQARVSVTTEPEVWVITGLAGDGKTALVNALNLLLGEGEFFEAPEVCPRRRIRGGIFLKMHAKTTKAEIVAMLAQQLGLDINCERAQPVHFEQIRLELYRQGCCFILADEGQSNDAGKQAGAAYVNLINLLRRFGLPVIFVGNYSMCHALWKQQSQNRQRLLNDPFIMPTLACDDPDYVAHLHAYQKALGQLWAIDATQDAARIHWLTAGGGRALLHLIGVAYCIRREGGAGADLCVDLPALEAAYAHQSFHMHRKEIEELRAHWLTGAKISNDLLCPFPDSGERELAQKHMVQQWRLAAQAAGMVISTMGPQERKRLAEGKGAPPQFTSSPPPAQPPHPPVETRSHPQPAPAQAQPGQSASNVGANLLKDLIAPKNRAVRRPPPTVDDLKRSWGR